MKERTKLLKTFCGFICIVALCVFIAVTIALLMFKYAEWLKGVLGL